MTRTPKPLAQTPTAVATLCGLAALTALSIEIILPAIGVIAREMETSDAAAATLISLYFVSYGVGQLLWGALSDRFGRRPMLYLGMSLFGAASIGCALAPDFATLLTFRVLQGLAGAAPIIARAIVRDVGKGAAAAQLMAVLAAVTAIAPLIAPAIGSGLLVLFGWRAAFVVLAAVSIVFLVMVRAWLPETLAERRPHATRPGYIWKRSKELFASRDFVIGALVSGLVFGGFASILSLGSLVAERAYAIPPEAFGSVYAVAAVFVVAGVLTTRRLVGPLGLRGIGTIAMSILAVAVAMHLWFLIRTPGFTLFWGGVSVYMLAFGFVLPSATTVALQPAEGMAGFASSLVGTVQMLIGALAAGAATLAYDGTHAAISLTMAGCGAAALAIFAAGRLIFTGRR